MDFYTSKPKHKLENTYTLFQPLDRNTQGLNSHEKTMLELSEKYRKSFLIVALRGITEGKSFDDLIKNDDFRIVVETIASEIGQDSSHLSKSTQEGYIRSFASLQRDLINNNGSGYRFYPEKLARKRSSMRTYKNAIHFMLREDLKRQKNLKRIFTSINTLLQCPYLLPGVRLARKLNAPKFEPARQPKHGIDQLPQNWQDRVYSRASSQMKPFLAILEATGCRPEELERGVKVRLLGGEVQYTIQNAKIGGHRELTTAVQGRSRDIVAYMKSLASTEMTFSKNKGALSQYFRDNRQGWGQGFEKITSYFYRYQKATDLKAMQIKGQISDRTVSQALGHLDLKTKNYYVATPGSNNVSINLKTARLVR